MSKREVTETESQHWESLFCCVSRAWGLIMVCGGHFGFNILITLGLQENHSVSLSSHPMCIPCVCVHFLSHTVTSGQQLLSSTWWWVSISDMDEVGREPWESQITKDTREVWAARITDRTCHIQPPSGRDEAGFWVFHLITCECECN